MTKNRKKNEELPRQINVTKVFKDNQSSREGPNLKSIFDNLLEHLALKKIILTMKYETGKEK